MKRLLLFALGMVTSLGAFAQQTSANGTVLEKVKTCFNSGKYDSIYSMCSDRIKSLITAEKMVQSMTGLYAQMGAIQTFEDQTPATDVPPARIKSRSAKGVLLDDRTEEKPTVGNYKTTFTNGVLILMISVNADHKLEALRFAPYTDPSAAKAVSNFVMNTPSCNIFGTLTMPEKGGKVPVVLIIAGSGPTDRDGNSHLGVHADTYRMISDSLRKEGIACLRYDKRGVGESKNSSQNESEMKFDDYVEDAVSLIRKLKSDGRFSKVIVTGHSEGSLIGMIAAGREPVAGYVSLAGAGERANKVLKAQFAQGEPAMVSRAGVMLDSLVAGHTVTNTDPAFESLFRRDVQPYLISWFQYDPQTEIAKLKIPVSIVQGTMDIQVPYAEAELLKKEKKDARIIPVKGMNHVLKRVDDLATREENIATYSDNKLPVCTEVIRELVRIAK